MSDTWHGYIYLPKSQAMTGDEWLSARARIRVITENKVLVLKSEYRFRERLSLSGNAVIYCIVVPKKVISAEGRAALARALQPAIPRFTVEQVEAYLAGSMVVFGGAGATWVESAAAARAAMKSEPGDWDYEISNS